MHGPLMHGPLSLIGHERSAAATAAASRCRPAAPTPQGARAEAAAAVEDTKAAPIAVAHRRVVPAKRQSRTRRAEQHGASIRRYEGWVQI